MIDVKTQVIERLVCNSKMSCPLGKVRLKTVPGLHNGCIALVAQFCRHERSIIPALGQKLELNLYLLALVI
jgi:hypothetical protein